MELRPLPGFNTGWSAPAPFRVQKAAGTGSLRTISSAGPTPAVWTSDRATGGRGGARRDHPSVKRSAKISVLTLKTLGTFISGAETVQKRCNYIDEIFNSESAKLLSA